jgi:type I restriction enzyme S subunit
MNSDPISFQRHIAYIAPDETKIDSNYLIYWLNSSFSRRYADLIAVGNAQKTVTLTELSKFPITFPCSHEQRQIYKMLEILDNKIFATEIEFDKLKKQKSGLMHDLLTGKVSVNVDSDAP